MRRDGLHGIDSRAGVSGETRDCAEQKGENGETNHGKIFKRSEQGFQRFFSVGVELQKSKSISCTSPAEAGFGCFAGFGLPRGGGSGKVRRAAAWRGFSKTGMRLCWNRSSSAGADSRVTILTSSCAVWRSRIARMTRPEGNSSHTNSPVRSERSANSSAGISSRMPPR